MNDQQDDGMSDFSNLEDEAFPPLPPPLSPGAAQSQGDPFGEAEEGEVSKLADVPAAKRKGVKRPQPKLDSHRLTSDRGLPALRTLFANALFKGKGHEAEDLRLLMQKMENWAHRLFPKLQFEDFIDRVEKLGSKKEVQTCLKRIRLDMPLTDEDFMDKPGAEEPPAGFQDPDPVISQASFTDPRGPVHSTPVPAPPSLTEEQRRRMEQNRQRALERRLARQQQTEPQTDTGIDLTADLNGSTEQNQKPGEHLDPDPSGSTKTPPPEVSEPDPPAELPAEDEKEKGPSSQP
ncbi:TIMELESS-interacting protein isoform X2 [Xiphophorus couchianus]|uniref:TIMELESS-interacting protein isoform X2 n=1 Tax=Xiphophorus couchianus TaxID=32473 RepID=UPI001016155C|nr:TIMELESS-interacting protein isoform X2 [Xiphophorus couchianus]